MKIYGKEGLIFADLHISDSYVGKHKNYLANCFDVLGRILTTCRKEKPKYVIFLGDLVGMKDKVIKRREVLLQLCTFFRELNAITNNNVFSVKGNHDMGEFTEFDYFSGMGLIKTSKEIGGYLDIYISEEATEPEIRYHLVDYGSERNQLDVLKNGDTSNIVLAHNNFTIADLTNWYNTHDGIELGSLTNFNGVLMVISGHIHNPSPMEIGTVMQDGQNCSLFYLGCPTRPTTDQGKYDHVYYARFTYNEEECYTDWKAEEFELSPVEDIFYDDSLFVNGDDGEDEPTEAEVMEEERRENLHVLIKEMTQSRMVTGDPFVQVDLFPYASDSAKAMCKKYIQMATDSINSKG